MSDPRIPAVPAGASPVVPGNPSPSEEEVQPGMPTGIVAEVPGTTKPVDSYAPPPSESGQRPSPEPPFPRHSAAAEKKWYWRFVRLFSKPTTPEEHLLNAIDLLEQGLTEAALPHITAAITREDWSAPLRTSADFRARFDSLFTIAQLRREDNPRIAARFLMAAGDVANRGGLFDDAARAYLQAGALLQEQRPTQPRLNAIDAFAFADDAARQTPPSLEALRIRRDSLFGQIRAAKRWPDEARILWPATARPYWDLLSLGTLAGIAHRASGLTNHTAPDHVAEIDALIALEKALSDYIAHAPAGDSPRDPHLLLLPWQRAETFDIIALAYAHLGTDHNIGSARALSDKYAQQAIDAHMAIAQGDVDVHAASTTTHGPKSTAARARRRAAEIYRLRAARHPGPSTEDRRFRGNMFFEAGVIRWGIETTARSLSDAQAAAGDFANAAVEYGGALAAQESDRTAIDAADERRFLQAWLHAVESSLGAGDIQSAGEHLRGLQDAIQDIDPRGTRFPELSEEEKGFWAVTNARRTLGRAHGEEAFQDPDVFIALRERELRLLARAPQTDAVLREQMQIHHDLIHVPLPSSESEDDLTRWRTQGIKHAHAAVGLAERLGDQRRVISFRLREAWLASLLKTPLPELVALENAVAAARQLVMNEGVDHLRSLVVPLDRLSSFHSRRTTGSSVEGLLEARRERFEVARMLFPSTRDQADLDAVLDSGRALYEALVENARGTLRIARLQTARDVLWQMRAIAVDILQSGLVRQERGGVIALSPEEVVDVHSRQLTTIEIWLDDVNFMITQADRVGHLARAEAEVARVSIPQLRTAEQGAAEGTSPLAALEASAQLAVLLFEEAGTNDAEFGPQAMRLLDEVARRHESAAASAGNVEERLSHLHGAALAYFRVGDIANEIEQDAGAPWMRSGELFLQIADLHRAQAEERLSDEYPSRDAGFFAAVRGDEQVQWATKAATRQFERAADWGDRMIESADAFFGDPTIMRHTAEAHLMAARGLELLGRPAARIAEHQNKASPLLRALAEAPTLTPTPEIPPLTFSGMIDVGGEKGRASDGALVESDDEATPGSSGGVPLEMVTDPAGPGGLPIVLAVSPAASLPTTGR